MPLKTKKEINQKAGLNNDKFELITSRCITIIKTIHQKEE